MYVYDTYMHIYRDVISVYITSQCTRDICIYVVMYVVHHDIYADVCIRYIHDDIYAYLSYTTSAYKS